MGPQTWQSAAKSRTGTVGGHGDLDFLDLSGAGAAGGDFHQAAKRKEHSSVARWGKSLARPPIGCPRPWQTPLVATCALSAIILPWKLDPRLHGDTRQEACSQALRHPLRSPGAGARTWEERGKQAMQGQGWCRHPSAGSEAQAWSRHHTGFATRGQSSRHPRDLSQCTGERVTVLDPALIT